MESPSVEDDENLRKPDFLKRQSTLKMEQKIKNHEPLVTCPIMFFLI